MDNRAPKSLSPRHHGWHTADVVRAAAAVLGVYYAVRFFYFAHTLFFVAFLGGLFGLAVSAGATRLQRYRIPRGVGSAAIVLGFVALLVGFGMWMGPTVQKQSRELRQRLPEAFAKADRWLGAHEGGTLGSLLSTEPDSDSAAVQAIVGDETPTTAHAPIPKSAADSDGIAATSSDTMAKPPLKHLTGLKNRLLDSVQGNAQRFVFPVITSTMAALSGIILVLFLTIYIATDPDTYRRGFLTLIPPARRTRWNQVITASSEALRKWLVTQLIAMVVIGSVCTALLLALNVRAALPLGILAGLLEFVPTVGPILSSVPAIAMGLIDSPEKALAVGVGYVGVQFLENHLLIPLLMKEGVDLPPVLTILTQATMALVFGFMGLFVAVPLLVLITIVVKMLYVEDVAGEYTELPFTEKPPPTTPSAP
jgi:predicted PurR-regulated permease PerM